MDQGIDFQITGGGVMPTRSVFFKCNECGEERNRVTDSRGTHVNGLFSIRRRRECTECGRRFTTYELPESEMFDTENFQSYMDFWLQAND